VFYRDDGQGAYLPLDATTLDQIQVGALRF